MHFSRFCFYKGLIEMYIKILAQALANSCTQHLVNEPAVGSSLWAVVWEIARWDCAFLFYAELGMDVYRTKAWRKLRNICSLISRDSDFEKHIFRKQKAKVRVAVVVISLHRPPYNAIQNEVHSTAALRSALHRPWKRSATSQPIIPVKTGPV